MEAKKTGLDLLREPFPANQISKLPKGTKAQNDCPGEQKRKCSICGGFHHPDVIHLDYVGHAALTDRLLDADPLWTWEPFAITPDGLPAFDTTGGLWIKLTVCGHTRIGYGHAEKSQYKEIGSREKEVIGDALRNAAMRFGAALDLWHKGDLHTDDDDEGEHQPKKYGKKPPQTHEDAPQTPEGDVPDFPALITEDQLSNVDEKLKKLKIPTAALVGWLKDEKKYIKEPDLRTLPMDRADKMLEMWSHEKYPVSVEVMKYYQNHKNEYGDAT